MGNPSFDKVSSIPFLIQLVYSLDKILYVVVYLPCGLPTIFFPWFNIISNLLYTIELYYQHEDEEVRNNKRFDYLVKALEPGAITTMRQLYSAITGVPYKGRVYDAQDVLTGLFTGVKPYDVDINRNIDFLISDYTKIRTKAFQASDLYDLDTYGDAVVEDFIRIQRNIFREQQRIYRALEAAKKFGVSKYQIKKEMKERSNSCSS